MARNRKNILAVADAIESSALTKARLVKNRIGFNMATYGGVGFGDKAGHNCGTAACIAGWTLVMFDDDGFPREKPLSPSELRNSACIMVRAAGALGLEDKVARKLFVPDVDILSDLAPQRAVRVLRHFARTGKVNWDLRAEKAPAHV